MALESKTLFYFRNYRIKPVLIFLWSRDCQYNNFISTSKIVNVMNAEDIIDAAYSSYNESTLVWSNLFFKHIHISLLFFVNQVL